MMNCFDLKKKLISVKKATFLIQSQCKPLGKSETIDIESSEGRIVSKSIKSTINVPPFDNSAVDGFAFNYDDYLKNKNKLFKIVDCSKPGYPQKKKISTSELIEIFTGAPVINKNKSLQIDTVVMEEDVIKCENDFIKLPKNVNKNSNIRKCAEDIKKNQIIYNKGRKIRSVDIGFLSSVGIKKIKVYNKVKVGVFSSGNEITNNENKEKFQIYDSNKLTLIFLLKKIGCEVFDLGILLDEYDETKKKILKATKKLDLILTSGGISSGKTDNISKVLLESGKLNVWKVAVKPGRPVAFGLINKIPFFGLPGNPVAAIITFLMFVKSYIYKMNGRDELSIKYHLVASDFNFTKKKERTEWLRGKLFEKNSKIFAKKYFSEGSGILSSVANTDGIIEIPDNKKYIKRGDMIKFYKYEELLN